MKRAEPINIYLKEQPASSAKKTNKQHHKQQEQQKMNEIKLIAIFSLDLVIIAYLIIITLLFFLYVQSRFACATSHRLRQRNRPVFLNAPKDLLFLLLATKAAKSKGQGEKVVGSIIRSTHVCASLSPRWVYIRNGQPDGSESRACDIIRRAFNGRKKKRISPI